MMNQAKNKNTCRLAFEDLKKKIISGELAVEQRMMTTEELSRYYGLSLMTMSRCIRRLKEEGFVNTAAGCGIFVNPRDQWCSNRISAARPRRIVTFMYKCRLERSSTESVTADYFQHLLDDMIIAIQEHSRELNIINNMVFIPATIQPNTEEFEKFIKSYCTDVDGALIGLGNDKDGMEKIIKAPLVFLHIGSPSSGFYSYNVICADLYRLAADAMDHLISRGYSRIACMAGANANISSYQSRLNAFRDSLNLHQLPCSDNQIFWCEENYQSMQEATQRIVALTPEVRPDAVFCFNDQRAVVLIEYLKRNNLRVPEDIAVIGFDGAPNASQMKISTVPLPFNKMGRTGIDMLLLLLDHKIEPPFCFVVNESIRIGTTT